MEGADLPVAKSLPARRARTVRRPMSACLVASTPATMGSTVLKEGEDMFSAESEGRWDLKFELRVWKDYHGPSTYINTPLLPLDSLPISRCIIITS